MQRIIQPRNLFCTFPFKMPLRRQKKKKSLYFLQKHCKKAYLKSQSYAHTMQACMFSLTDSQGHIILLQIILLLQGTGEKQGREDAEVGLTNHGRVHVILDTYMKERLGGQRE